MNAFQSVFRWVTLISLTTMLATIPTNSIAEGPGWNVKGTVTQLVVTIQGGVNVRLLPELVNCVSQSGYGPAFASIYPTHPGINRMKADLLVAYLSGKPVRLYFTDSSCTVGELILGE